MGMSNSEMLDLDALEIDILSRPTLEFQEQEEEVDECRILQAASLRIKVPAVSLGELKNTTDGEDYDGRLSTPKSSDHKIPEFLQCPAAPRKPKSRPYSLAVKRKAQSSSSSSSSSSQRRIFHVLSNEIEGLFPPDLRADLGKKIKKAKQIK